MESKEEHEYWARDIATKGWCIDAWSRWIISNENILAEHHSIRELICLASQVLDEEES